MPGKFEGAIDEQIAEELYDLSLEGGADEEMGDVQEVGHFFMLFTDMEEYGGKSFILCEDNFGFVDYDEFDTAEAAEKAWKRYASLIDRLYENQEEEGEEGEEDGLDL